jgi:hypothetical protein
LRLARATGDFVPPARVAYFCGLPASGKTECALHLAHTRSAAVFPEFLDPFPTWIRDSALATPEDDVIARELWILGQHVRKNQMVEGERGAIVVVDRTFLDVGLYSSLLGEEVLQRVVDEAVGHPWVAGEFFLFFANPEVIRQRLVTRYGCTAREWEEIWEPLCGGLAARVSALLDTGVGVPIDTTECSTVEVAAAIVRRLAQ